MIDTDPRNRRLVVLPALRLGETPGGKVIVTKKFIDGMKLYLDYWEGPICVLAERSHANDDNLDHVIAYPSELPFDVQLVEFDRKKLPALLNDGDVLLLSLERKQCFIADDPRLKGPVKVFVSEYSLRTRNQIARCSTVSPLKLMKRTIKEAYHESLFRRAVSLADGVQCNGTPTYRDYRPLNDNAMLFYDTRVSEDMLATEEKVRGRGVAGPLRLIFSGRLIKMKGADHLVHVARHLVKLGVDFEMAICGSGVLETSMKDAIQKLDLGKYVKMKGVFDFESELVPMVQNQTDLFICCHRQGDPSCTYLETMACGVPIVGYDNEAFRGIVEDSNCGWLSPIDRPELMALEIARLAGNREEILHHALATLKFARRHTFEKTFKRRIDHLKELAMSPRSSVMV